MLKAKQINALAQGLSGALLRSPWDVDSMIDSMAKALGRKWRWRRPLAQRLFAAYARPPSDARLVQAIIADPSFQKAVNDRTRPHIVRWQALATSMPPTFPEWDLPRINTIHELCLQLGLSYAQLMWLADCEHRQKRGDPLRSHYRSYWMRKPRGGWRLVEEPLGPLKSVQRHILHELLDKVVPHPAACAFRHSRSIIDYARPHTGKALVLHLDLKNFFTSIPASRVHAMWTTLGYPQGPARILTGLCTSTVPLRTCRQHPGGELYSAPHLPQGAPTSPALANLAAFHLDRRLSAAAKHLGADYTRYADDLAFSGDIGFSKAIKTFLPWIWAIISEEGFEINHRKTRVMHKSVRQRLCGLVVNEHVNIDRRLYDRLKATLTNCGRHGLASQNRKNHPHFRAHLQGQVTYMEHINPARGARLRTLLNKIAADGPISTAFPGTDLTPTHTESTVDNTT